MIKILSLISCLVAFSIQCPHIKGMDNINIDQYISKKWWIQAQFETKYLKKDYNYCVSAEYSKFSSKSFWGFDVQVHNVAQNQAGMIMDSGSIICAKITDNASELNVGLCKLPRINGYTTGSYIIVDYNEELGYALVAGGQPRIQTPEGCKYDTNQINESGLWIFTRQQQRDEELVQNVKDKARSMGFDLSGLGDVDNTQC